MMNHYGARYYQEGVPTEDLAYTMVKKTMGKLLSVLFWPLRIIVMPILLHFFLRWIRTEHDPAQRAREQTHPHSAWRAPTNPSCSGCGKKESEAEKKLKTCSRCRVAMYCTRDCQKKDHKVHKKVCVGLAA